MPAKTLPHRDSDAVQSLSAHYFLAADLMLANYDKLKVKFERNGRLSRNDEVNSSIYWATWIGYLGVMCESFRNLNMRRLLQNERPDEFLELVPQVDQILSNIQRHFDALRKFRNSVFHLRPNAIDMLAFLTDPIDRMSWARQLHGEFRELLSSYRILCEVHYLLNGRDAESNLKSKRKKST